MRKYLPREVKSFERVYQKYAEGVPNPMSKSAFFKLMKSKFNIGIHTPRKDKCLVCVHEKGQGQETPSAEYQAHIAEKKVVSALVNQVKAADTSEDERVASFDLQKVLTTPHSDSMTIGFSGKYAVYNETVYEHRSKRGLCC